MVVTVVRGRGLRLRRHRRSLDRRQHAASARIRALSAGHLLSSYLARDRSDNTSPAYLTFYLNR
jgi:hypothetical protein